MTGAQATTDTPEEPTAGAPPPKEGRGRARMFLALKLLGTAAGLGYVLSVAELSQIAEVVRDVPATALAAAVVLTALNVVVAAVRWRVMLKTYGAEKPPSLLRLTHLYLVGLFYNNFLPGGLGGDVVRGVVSREAFGPSGITAAMTVVLVERVLGLTGLLILTAVALAIRPLPGVENAVPYSIAGLLLAVTAIVGIAASRRLAPVLPGPIGRIAAHVPAIEFFPGFFGGVLLSLCTQTMVALSGHMLLVAAAPQVTLTDSLVVVPVAVAAAFFPLTVGGAGAREAAFVVLCTTALGMREADAAAVSLLLWLCQLVVAGTGGLIQLVVPVRADNPAR